MFDFFYVLLTFFRLFNVRKYFLKHLKIMIVLLIQVPIIKFVYYLLLKCFSMDSQLKNFLYNYIDLNLTFFIFSPYRSKLLTLQRSILAFGFLLASFKQQCQIQWYSGRVTVIGVENENRRTEFKFRVSSVHICTDALRKVMNQSLLFPALG